MGAPFIFLASTCVHVHVQIEAVHVSYCTCTMFLVSSSRAEKAYLSLCKQDSITLVSHWSASSPTDENLWEIRSESGELHGLRSGE